MNKELPEKVIYAVLREQQGCSLKDFLTDQEIVEALSMLADIFVCIGVRAGEEA